MDRKRLGGSSSATTARKCAGTSCGVGGGVFQKFSPARSKSWAPMVGTPWLVSGVMLLAALLWLSFLARERTLRRLWAFGRSHRAGATGSAWATDLGQQLLTEHPSPAVEPKHLHGEGAQNASQGLSEDLHPAYDSMQKRTDTAQEEAHDQEEAPESRKSRHE